MENEILETFGVKKLLEVGGASREASSYAFLYATFKQTEVTRNPVRDALDCFVPFIAVYLEEISGKQVTASGIQEHLQRTFGFHVPLYAIEQLFGSLTERGLVEYIVGPRIYVARSLGQGFLVAKNDIETDFDGIASALSSYAKKVGFDVPPPAGDWGEALIQFLRQLRDRPKQKLISIKSVMVDPNVVQDRIVASYLAGLGEAQSPQFRQLVNVFLGVLIEDFIESISSTGDVGSGSGVNVFYDTAVLLRLLGCSGKMLQTATLELTSYLDGIGCKIYYFSGNEAEVGAILDTIIHRKDTGKEIEGETAAALADGEIAMADLRLLQNTVPERLAQLGVFSARDLERSVVGNKDYQIDEKQFSRYLFDRAVERGRAYGLQNRDNDASYVATVMRLRRGVRTRDFVNCGYLFVTQNNLLSSTSRRFLIQEKLLYPQDCAPVLSVGQIATIAWLMKDRKLSAEMASRELLSNCYAAMNPDAEWFGFFREGIEKVTGSLEEFAADPTGAMTLQAARRIATEESFGHSMIVRDLNMVEILQRAKERERSEQDRIDSEREAERREAKAALDSALTVARAREEELERRASERQAAAVEEAELRARAAAELDARQQRSSLARRRAGAVLGFVRFALLAVFILAVVAAAVQGSGAWWGFTVVVALLTIASAADLLRLPLLRFLPAAMLDWLTRQFERL